MSILPEDAEINKEILPPYPYISLKPQVPKPAGPTGPTGPYGVSGGNGPTGPTGYTGPAGTVFSGTYGQMMSSLMQMTADSTPVLIVYNTVLQQNNIVCFTSGTFTILYTGFYLVTGAITYDMNATGTRKVLFYINGVQAFETAIPACPDQDTIVNGTQFFFLNAGDSVSMYSYQTMGGFLGMMGATCTVCRIS